MAVISVLLLFSICFNNPFLSLTHYVQERNYRMNVQRIVTRGSMIAASACFMLVALSGCPEPGDVVITVSPEQSSVEVGETTTFNAFSTDIFESISWQSSDTSIATIDATS